MHPELFLLKSGQHVNAGNERVTQMTAEHKALVFEYFERFYAVSCETQPFSGAARQASFTRDLMDAE